MSVTLSCDHRVIDGRILNLKSFKILYNLKEKCEICNIMLFFVCSGAIGADWLKAFKGYIENPESMLL